jgi:putative ABC transport system permease protein
VNIESVKERYEWYHKENSNYVKLIGSCCLISMFLSMIGLFALSYNSSLKRTKEIGIRKINGAKTSDIISLLNKDFIRWIVIAFIFAAPVAWYIMHKWLENFAYKTVLNWWTILLAGIFALAIALLTVSWQSWRAATRNPVEALRYE